MNLLEVEHGIAKFDLTLSLTDAGSGGRYQGWLEYNSDLFEETTAAQMARHWVHVLRQVIADPTKSITAYSLLNADERHRQVVTWNDTDTPVSTDLCVHELIVAQAERSPEAHALICADQTLTYGELIERASRLAHHLRSLNVGPDTVVALLFERSVEMVVALLGVLEAGGAYLPLDPEDPAERLSFAVRDAGADVVLTCRAFADRAGEHAARVICLDDKDDKDDKGDEWAAIAQHPATPPASACTADHLAYVIYTSGSTGKPKGVQVSHRAIVNRLFWHQETFPLAPGHRVLQKTPYTFDVSVWEFFWPLLNGATLVLARPQGHRDPYYLAQLIGDAGITCMHFVPSMLRAFVDALRESGRHWQWPDLAWVLCSGEALPRELVNDFFATAGTDVELHNLYGPTEAAVDVTHWHCVPDADERTIPIGRPVSNTQIYILDETLQPTPAGVAGELYIGGIQVARGYLGRAALTAARFVPDPFSSTPGARLYRTGDLVRYRRQTSGATGGASAGVGVIEFLGRIDFQVKLRGFRIELGEIEATLMQHEDVRQAVALVREDRPGDLRLCAYVVTQQHDGEPDSRPILQPEALREHLSQSLPQHMMPNAFVMLAELPLTTSGKVDRKALPMPQGHQEREGGIYRPPETPEQILVADIYATVLGIERAGLSDHFFHVGGHSLLATQVVARLRTALSLDVPLRAVFEAPTVAGLAAYITTMQTTPADADMPALVPIARDETHALSYAQERLWFLNQLQPDSPFYNIPGGLRLRGELDANALQQAFCRLIERHEVLRTTYVNRGGKPRQRIGPSVAVTIPCMDISAAADLGETALADAVREEAETPFDLTQDLMVRAKLLRMDRQEHVLLVTLHHIAADGWSMGILLSELAALYSAYSANQDCALPALQVQVVDVASWQRQWFASGALDEQLSYWRQALAGLSPLELPTDRSRPAQQQFRGDRVVVEVDKALGHALQQLSRDHDCTLFMTLLASWQLLLARYAGQGDIAVGTPIANRQRAELEPLIGCFVNTLVMRTQISGEQSFAELLQLVKQTALDAYANQDLPFEHLVESLDVERDLSRNPLFDVMFSLQPSPLTDLQLKGLASEAVDIELGIAKFDLTLSLIEEGQAGSIRGFLEYDSALFDRSTAERMATHWQALLTEIAADPNRSVARYPLLSSAEQEQVLRHWNDTGDVAAIDRCMHDLISDQVGRTPEATAVIHGQESLSYQELEWRSNQVANRLRQLGVTAETVVGVCLDRNLDLMISLVAILKCGGVYLPLDPAYPRERIEVMLKDADAMLVLTSPEHRGLLTGAHLEFVGNPEWAAQSTTRPDVTVDPQQLAYLIYTSGSTGRPKGVAIAHASAVVFLRWAVQTFDANEMAHLAATTSVCFDLSIFELFAPLTIGGTVHILRDALALAEYSKPISLANTVPSAMNELVRLGAEPVAPFPMQSSEDTCCRW